MWYNWFKEGREHVNDDASSRRPNISTPDINIEAVNKTIFDNRRITIREVADDVGISLLGIWQAIILNVLGVKRAAAKIVPKLLNFEQKKKTSHGQRSGDVENVQ